MTTEDTTAGFLAMPDDSPGAQSLFEEDLAELGYVMNATRLWAYQPESHSALFHMLGQAQGRHQLSVREKGILITAMTSRFGDSYGALAWSGKLAQAAETDTATEVLRGADHGLSDRERALADWARKVGRSPSATTTADVEQVRAAGVSDEEIFSVTPYVALRIAFSTVAFSTVNDALGARPDAELVAALPAPVAEAVTRGRPPEETDGDPT